MTHDQKSENSIDQLITFWFSSKTRKHWFASTPDFDALIRKYFAKIWKEARQGKLEHWADSAQGALALCIVLDQFPLHLFRGKAESFSTEQQAVMVSKRAIEHGLDDEVDDDQIAFLYMPLMHSENLQDQELSVALFEKRGLQDNLRFARHHRDLIREYGRFPHRNSILGRQSTQAEIDYLRSKRAFKG